MKITCVIGTRPEVIKMAPVVLRLRRGEGNEVRVLATGQHRGLLDQALADFRIVADDDLDLMRPHQTLADLTARTVVALSGHLERHRPDLVLAQGDTTTVFCTALACYYHRVPFGHVEAGLRTGNPYFPFPEEKNRVLAGHLAELHFAPTLEASRNLRKEGIAAEDIHITGNTVIDALLTTAGQDVPLPIVPATPRYLLVTAHRRENFGKPLEEICRALRDLVEHDPDLSIVYPVHPNPRVLETVTAELQDRDRAHLIEPVNYPQFVALMKHSYAILSDSGGVQEEGPALGKPVLVLRDETERPEAVAAGTVRLVGPHHDAIVAATRALCDRPEVYAQFARATNPYGDGHAADRIAAILAQRYKADFGRPDGPIPPWPPDERRDVSSSPPVTSSEHGVTEP